MRLIEQIKGFSSTAVSGYASASFSNAERARVVDANGRMKFRQWISLKFNGKAAIVGRYF
jgi:hypothetical protein